MDAFAAAAAAAAADDNANDNKNKPKNITPIQIMYYFSIVFVILNTNALILRCIAVYRDGTSKN